jgi:HK97 family phage prohead protease
MPYTIKEEDGRFCVYKKGDDDMPMGEAIHCHDSADEAQAQIGALMESEEKSQEKGLLIKSVNDEERIIEGYAATWDVDDEGEAFDPKAFSNSLNRYMNRPVLLFSHGQHEDIKLNAIGRVLEAKVTQMGLWVRAQIYKGDRYAEAAWNLVKQGAQNFSVGAAASLVRKMGNRITEWPLVEISVAPFSANPMARFQIVKEMMPGFVKAIGLEDLDIEAKSEDVPSESKALEDTKNKSDGVKKMEENMNELIGKAVADAIAAKEKEASDKALAEKAFSDAVAKKVEEEIAKKQVNRKIAFGAQEDRIEVAGAYDHVDPAQLALGHMVMKSIGIQPSVAYSRTLIDLVSKSFKNGALRTKEYMPTGAALKGMGAPLTFGNKHDAYLERTLATKADELMGSDVSTYGDEWIPVYYSRELIPLIRNQAKVLGLFRQLEVQGESLVIPIQTGSVTWYKTAQTDDTAESAYDNAFITARVSKPSTSNITLTPKKLSAIAMWTGEMDEQSLVPMLPFLQSEMAISGAEVIDEILISGDTVTTSSNVSDYGDGSISTSWHLLLAKGLRAHALLDGSAANARSGSTLTAEDFLLTKKLMGTNGSYALDPSKLVWVIDPGIYWKMQSLGEALTLEKFGPGFTFQSGVLERIFGSPVIVSDKYGLTDSSGYINNTTGSNTLGSFLCVRPDQAVVGFGRRMKVETQRIARSDSYEIVAHMMLDFDLSTYDAIGYTYNVTVA